MAQFKRSRKRTSSYRWGWLLVTLTAVLPAMPLGASESELPPVPGRLIDVGGYRLHIQCTGDGADLPTVVLEAGLGGSALEWSLVQRELSGSLRVCSYDRAGMGWSDPGVLPRASATVAEELHALLNKAEIPGPYVLVGHSLGGYSVRLFASRNPGLIAGLVFVDASHPQQIARFAADPVRVNIAPKGKLMQLMPVHVPDQLRAAATQYSAAVRLAKRYQARLAVTQELQNFRLSARQVAAADRLPDIPLLVLSRGQQKWPKTSRGNRMEALWQQLQSELAGQTSLAAQIIARRSGHHIHLDQPALVSQAIRLVASAGRYPAGDARQRTWLLRALRDTAKRFAQTAAVDYATVARPLLAMRQF